MTKGDDIGKLFEMDLKQPKIIETYFLLFWVLLSSIIELAIYLLQI